jgi:hypothetical protein
MSDRRRQRHLQEVQQRLEVARQSLRVLEEQVAVWRDAREDARIRSLVSETPQVQADYNELVKHVTAAEKELERRTRDVKALISERDEQLRRWTPTENE